MCSREANWECKCSSTDPDGFDAVAAARTTFGERSGLIQPFGYSPYGLGDIHSDSRDVGLQFHYIRP
jgi:hypothetical protein